MNEFKSDIERDAARTRNSERRSGDHSYRNPKNFIDDERSKSTSWAYPSTRTGKIDMVSKDMGDKENKIMSQTYKKYSDRSGLQNSNDRKRARKAANESASIFDPLFNQI
jgi:hypothetical protein